MSRFTPADRAFILARVLEHCAAHPPDGPLLTEVYAEPAPKREACKRGHPRVAAGECAECRAAWKRRKRAEGVSW